MIPQYVPNFIYPIKDIAYFISKINWLTETSARKECFMTKEAGVSYTYGEGRGQRTYTSVEMNADVYAQLLILNAHLFLTKQPGDMNGCFLNYYETQHNALGWHSDNFDKMDHTKPVCVISFGEPREIWFRKIGETGVVPETQKQILEPGSLLIMSPGYQHTHEHRIPKGSKAMGPRVSLTFRSFK